MSIINYKLSLINLPPKSQCHLLTFIYPHPTFPQMGKAKSRPEWGGI